MMTANCESHEPTDAEITAAQQALAQWQTPQEFVSKVEGFAPLIRSSTLFNKPNVGFLLDAIPIAEFTKHRDVQSVRLVEQKERLNDGQFKNAGEIADIEVTEVMEPGRRRGDEYRCTAKPQAAKDFDPNLGKTIATALANGIKKKAEKNYATKPLLLVYLNVSTGGKLGDEVETEINKLKAKYADTFREICVLWVGRLY